jgi:hypothetical protein
MEAEILRRALVSALEKLHGKLNTLYSCTNIYMRLSDIEEDDKHDARARFHATLIVPVNAFVEQHGEAACPPWMNALHAFIVDGSIEYPRTCFQLIAGSLRVLQSDYG